MIGAIRYKAKYVRIIVDFQSICQNGRCLAQFNCYSDHIICLLYCIIGIRRTENL